VHLELKLELNARVALQVVLLSLELLGVACVFVQVKNNGAFVSAFAQNGNFFDLDEWGRNVSFVV
jgi:hypothetical protein